MRPQRRRRLCALVTTSSPPQYPDAYGDLNGDRGNLEREIEKVLQHERNEPGPHASCRHASIHPEPLRKQDPGERDQRRDGDGKAPVGDPLNNEVLGVRVDDVLRADVVRGKNALECPAAYSEDRMIQEQRLGSRYHLELLDVLVEQRSVRIPSRSEPGQKRATNDDRDDRERTDGPAPRTTGASLYAANAHSEEPNAADHGDDAGTRSRQGDDA